METKDILIQLRKDNNLTQEELAKRLFVTRQAVSRWETGETLPNTETLKLISAQFNVSINTLLGSPRALICQCCGMPLTDDILSKESDGSLNEDYCKWCYSDGQFAYNSIDEIKAYLMQFMKNHGMAEEQAEEYINATIPKLKRWAKK